MIVPIRPGTTHIVGLVCDIHPLVGKWETLTGEGGFGVRGVGSLDMIGAGERDRAVRRIVMEVCGWGGEVEREEECGRWVVGGFVRKVTGRLDVFWNERKNRKAGVMVVCQSKVLFFPASFFS